MIITLLSMAVALANLTSPVPYAEISVRAEAFPNIPEGGIGVGCTTIESGVTLFGSEAFGGLSAMRLDGDSLVMISDAAGVFLSRPSRNDDGWIVDLEDVRGGKLAGGNGKPLRKRNGDSEGLVVLDQDEAWVSFEGKHRVVRFRRNGGIWNPFETAYRSDAKVLSNNSGFEALTKLADGRLMGISEGTDDNGLAMVIIQNGTVWDERTYRPADGFSVTDAATDPMTGDVVVLERAFSRATGPRARLARVAHRAVDSDEAITGVELARYNFFHGIDNMEGIILERTDTDGLRAHLLSDDNFSDIQRTVLMGIAIDESSSCMPSPATEMGQRDQALSKP